MYLLETDYYIASQNKTSLITPLYPVKVLWSIAVFHVSFYVPFREETKTWFFDNNTQFDRLSLQPVSC